MQIAPIPGQSPVSQGGSTSDNATGIGRSAWADVIAIVVDDDVVLGIAVLVDMGSKKSGIHKRHQLRWCLNVVKQEAGSFERLEPLSGG